MQWFHSHRQEHTYSLQDLLSYYGVSRQAYHQALDRENRRFQVERSAIGLILEVRCIHPGMGLRSIYELSQPEELGRDRFMEIGRLAGLILDPVSSSPRTTIPHPSASYPNLLEGLKLTGVNQLWTSDITYFRIGEKWCYLTFVMDVYSRRIIGYKASENMRAINNVDALNMGLHVRGIKDYKEDLIHHSDRGSQYVSDVYVELLRDYHIQISMCSNVLENAHVERVNGTIKNQYLKHRPIKSIAHLRKWLDQAVYAYNYQRPHKSLGMPPVAFENWIQGLPVDSKQRPSMDIFYYEQNSDKVDPAQLEFEFNIS